MGSITQIDNWQDSRRDIEAGRQLLTQFDRSGLANSVILKIIMQYSNSGTQDLISKELARIRELLTARKQPAPIVSRVEKTQQKQIDLPSDLAQLEKDTKRLYQELDTLRGKSRMIPDGNELKEIVLKIVRMRKQINKNYGRINHFREFGIHASPKVEELSQDAQVKQLTRWLRALKTHPPYISKHKKSEKPSIIKEVARRRQELGDINEYLENAV